MAQVLDGLTLPHYANNGFKELITPKLNKNYSMDGTLWVDTSNIRSGWKITFEVITVAKYLSQFSTGDFLRFVDNELSIDTYVFMSMPAERDISWNKSVTKGLSITLEPESADEV